MLVEGVADSGEFICRPGNDSPKKVTIYLEVHPASEFIRNTYIIPLSHIIILVLSLLLVKLSFGECHIHLNFSHLLNYQRINICFVGF